MAPPAAAPGRALAGEVLADSLHSCRSGWPHGVVVVDEVPDATLFERLSGPFDARARSALASLYERHAAAVRAFLSRFGGTAAQDCDDWLHDTFMTAMRQAPNFRAGSARPWLLALAAQRVRDSRKSERRRRERAERAAIERQERAQPAPCASALDLERHIGALAERHRVMLELRFVQALTHCEVADVLGVSVRTAKAWATEALAALRAKLEAEGEVTR